MGMAHTLAPASSGGLGVNELSSVLCVFMEPVASVCVLVGRMGVRGVLGVSIKLTPMLVDASTFDEEVEVDREGVSCCCNSLSTYIEGKGEKEGGGKLAGGGSERRRQRMRTVPTAPNPKNTCQCPSPSLEVPATVSPGVQQ